MQLEKLPHIFHESFRLQSFELILVIIVLRNSFDAKHTLICDFINKHGKTDVRATEQLTINSKTIV